MSTSPNTSRRGSLRSGHCTALRAACPEHPGVPQPQPCLLQSWREGGSSPRSRIPLPQPHILPAPGRGSPDVSVLVAELGLQALEKPGEREGRRMLWVLLAAPAPWRWAPFTLGCCWIPRELGSRKEKHKEAALMDSGCGGIYPHSIHLMCTSINTSNTPPSLLPH